MPDPAVGNRGGTQPTRSVKAAHARVARALDPGRDTNTAPQAARHQPGRDLSPPDGRAEPKSKRARQRERARGKQLATQRAANVAKPVEARARRTAAASAKGKGAGAAVAPRSASTPTARRRQDRRRRPGGGGGPGPRARRLVSGAGLYHRPGARKRGMSGERSGVYRHVRTFGEFFDLHPGNERAVKADLTNDLPKKFCSTPGLDPRDFKRVELNTAERARSALVAAARGRVQGVLAAAVSAVTAAPVKQTPP